MSKSSTIVKYNHLLNVDSVTISELALDSFLDIYSAEDLPADVRLAIAEYLATKTDKEKKLIEKIVRSIRGDSPKCLRLEIALKPSEEETLTDILSILIKLETRIDRWWIPYVLLGEDIEGTRCGAGLVIVKQAPLYKNDRYFPVEVLNIKEIYALHLEHEKRLLEEVNEKNK